MSGLCQRSACPSFSGMVIQTHTRGLTESWPLSNRHQALSQVDGNMKNLSSHQTRGFDEEREEWKEKGDGQND